METTTTHVPALHEITSSSNITALGHRDGQLFIKFTSGKTYRYDNVTAKQFGDLLQAESKGRACGEFIRGTTDYPCCLCVDGDDH